MGEERKVPDVLKELLNDLLWTAPSGTVGTMPVSDLNNMILRAFDRFIAAHPGLTEITAVGGAVVVGVSRVIEPGDPATVSVENCPISGREANSLMDLLEGLRTSVRERPPLADCAVAGVNAAIEVVKNWLGWEWDV
jgi:hypothetical protein